jgi:hypothetical protein
VDSGGYPTADDLVRTEWLKALDEGLHEFRVRHDADEVARMFGGDPPEVEAPEEKVLLRVFVHFYGDKVILLRRQQREIADARRLLAQFKERERRARRQAVRPKQPKRKG